MGRPARDTGVGKGAVGSAGVIVLTILFGGASLLLLYGLMAFWPPSFPPDVTTVPNTTAQFLGLAITLDRERSLLVIVALAGAMGATTHVLRSFYRYAGERHLVWSWIPTYVLTPFVGALLATLTYLVVRAGLITGGGAALGNPFGFTAIATLVGLFSAQAAEKLKQVFETVFAPAPTASEAIGSAVTPVVISFDPESGHAGDSIEIRGVGLDTATEVRFGRIPAQAAWDAHDAVLRTRVPRDAKTGALAVVVGSTVATSSRTFTVLPDEPVVVAVGPGADGGSIAAVVVSPGVSAPAVSAVASNGNAESAELAAASSSAGATAALSPGRPD